MTQQYTHIVYYESSSIRSGLLPLQLVREHEIILCSKSWYNFLPLLSIIIPFPQFSINHFVPSGSRPFLIAHFPANTFSALTCLLYSAPATALHPASTCWTVSLSWLHKRHSSCSTKPLILQALVPIMFL